MEQKQNIEQAETPSEDIIFTLYAMVNRLRLQVLQ